MKIIISSFLLIISLNGIGQLTTTQYFDENIQPVDKKQAVFFGTVTMDSGLYKLSCYYQKKKNQLAFVARFSDDKLQVREGSFHSYYKDATTNKKGNYRSGKKEGLWKRYWDEKVVEECFYKNGMGVMRTGFYSLDDPPQRLVFVDDVANNMFTATLYNQLGQIISEEKIPQDYTDIYINDDLNLTENALEWERYAARQIKIKSGKLDPKDLGTVVTRFVVDTDGNVTDLRALNLKDSKVAEVALGAFNGGPKWIPAQNEGKKVKVIVLQTFTSAMYKGGAKLIDQPKEK